MGKPVLFMVLLLSIGILQAQANENLVVNGTVLTLSAPSGSRYQHIDFPRRNMIIKRGAIADFNNLIGKKLVVDNLTTKSDGTLEVILKRKDGLNFFRFFTTVKADFNNAVANGELILPKKTKEDSLAQE